MTGYGYGLPASGIISLRSGFNPERRFALSTSKSVLIGPCRFLLSGFYSIPPTNSLFERSPTYFWLGARKQSLQSASTRLGINRRIQFSTLWDHHTSSVGTSD